MASTKLNRYLSVQRAKGQSPDPMMMSKLLREDVESDKSIRRRSLVEAPSVEGAGGAVTSLESPGPTSVSLGDLSSGTIPGDVGDMSSSSPTLGEAASAQMGIPSLSRGAVKGAIKGGATAVAASQMGAPPNVALQAAAMSAFSPMAMASLLSSLGVNSVSASIMANDVTNAFGEEAAQEAANVMSGRAELSAISAKGQSAYANMQTAIANNPRGAKGLASAIKGSPTISTVTPHHTPQAIAAAFGGPSPTGFGPDQFGASMQGMHAALEASGLAVSGDGGGSGSSVGGAPGASGMGIGPGNY